MENTTHLFLAVRFNCNKCHDHPFERWTQDQYYHLAAYFAQVGRKEDPAVRRPEDRRHAPSKGPCRWSRSIYDSGERRREARPHRARSSPPSFPYDARRSWPPAERARREQLAHWITSKDNQYFAKSYVNRLWGYLFGVGIIEPIDDIRAGNPPTNPELLDALTKDFIASGFDAQHMLRTICKSRTYQLSIVDQQVERGRHDQLLARHSPAAAGRSAVRRDPPRDRLDREAARRARRLPRGPAARRRRLGAVPRRLRQAGPRIGLRMRALQRHGARADPEADQRPDGGRRPGRSGQRAEPARRQASRTTRKLIEEVFVRFLARKPTRAELKLGVEALKAAAADHAKAAAALAEYEKQLPAKQAAWEASLGKPVVWQPLEPSEMKSAAGATLTKQDDKSILVTGNAGQGRLHDRRAGRSARASPASSSKR